MERSFSFMTRSFSNSAMQRTSTASGLRCPCLSWSRQTITSPSCRIVGFMRKRGSPYPSNISSYPRGFRHQHLFSSCSPSLCRPFITRSLRPSTPRLSKPSTRSRPRFSKRSRERLYRCSHGEWKDQMHGVRPSATLEQATVAESCVH